MCRPRRARTRPTPFGEHRLHHFGNRRLPHSDITIEIFRLQALRIGAIEQSHIVMANVLEIPVGAAITGHQGLPLLQRRCRIEPPLRQPRPRRQIGEGEAFAGKGHIGTTRIFERAAIGADTVIMADTLIDDEGQFAA